MTPTPDLLQYGSISYNMAYLFIYLSIYQNIFNQGDSSARGYITPTCHPNWSTYEHVAAVFL